MASPNKPKNKQRKQNKKNCVNIKKETEAQENEVTV